MAEALLSSDVSTDTEDDSDEFEQIYELIQEDVKNKKQVII